MCRKKKKDERAPEKTHQVTATLSDDDEYSLHRISMKTTNPLVVTVTLDERECDMEVDTGASVSIMSEERFKQLRDKGVVLSQSQAKLFTYTGEQIPVIGVANVQVKHNSQVATLPLIVTGGAGPTLLGRNWLSTLRLNWSEIFTVHTSHSLQDLLETYSEVFTDELGTVRGTTATIRVDPSATPRFHKARPLPYTLKAKVEKELERLEKMGVIEPVRFSEWAAPIVPVMKSDGTVRLCGDYKVTVNQAAQQEQYPIPKIDDLFASLAGGRRFTKLDLSHAYQQVQLDETSRQFVIINTHKGLFKYNRLPFGVSSAPSIFQRIMETLLQGIPGVCVYIDDILITGRTVKEHLEHLEEVLKRMKEAGMRLKSEKCAYLLPSVEYLGHTISEEGLKTAESKVEAITGAPAPRNVTELRSFLGLVNYYAKFLPNLSTTLTPLYTLLQKNHKWSWSSEQTKAFEEVKRLLQTSEVLVHFDDKLPLILSCDASPYGVGAVLAHRMPNGDERPISFASRTLTECERKYSQLEKEALAIIFGVKKYHQYIYGRPFNLKTDHKPLMYIFSEKKGIPAMASGRIQRWALILGAYQYTIGFQKGSDNTTADAVSRLPLPVTRTEPPKPAEVVHLMEYLDTSPVTSSQIRLWTDQDPVLAKIKSWILSGWPENPPIEEDVRPFLHRQRELSVEDGILLWGSRVVVPQKGKKQVLTMLHQAHPGITRMKSLARCYVWWPGIDSDLELRVKSCEACQVNQKSPPNVPLHPWVWPSRPWSRVHIDYAGPFMGKMFLLVIDAYTKWLDVHVSSTSSSASTIESLRRSFATYGLPEVVVSDNAANFTSEEFQSFLKSNGVKHVRTPPYHPASNGIVERAVQMLKSGLRKFKIGSVETKVSRFLFWYRTTPHSSTGASPGELMFGRRLHSPLDNIRPNLDKKMQLRQEHPQSSHSRPRVFRVGEFVYARNYATGDKWLPGKIVQTIGSTMYDVLLDDGRKVRKHADQLRSRVPVEVISNSDNESDASDEGDVFDARIPHSEDGGHGTETAVSTTAEVTTPPTPSTPTVPELPTMPPSILPNRLTEDTNSNPPGPRRSTRSRQRTNFYGYGQS